MKRSQLPDQDAYITVHLRSGKSVTGYVDAGHVWASEDGGDQTLICLARGVGTKRPNTEMGEALWQYVEVADICAFEWDCLP